MSGGGKPNTLVSGVEDRVVAFAANTVSEGTAYAQVSKECVQECVTIDEVKTFAAVCAQLFKTPSAITSLPVRQEAHIVDDQVDVVARAADVGIQRARPDLGIGAESIGRPADFEVERAQCAVLRGADLQEASRLIKRRTGRLLVSIKGIYQT